MNAADVMTTGAATVRPDTPLAQALMLLVEHRISGLPVVDANELLVGLISESDFLRPKEGRKPRLLEFLANDGTRAASELAALKVEDLMTTNAISVAVDTPVDEIVELMNRHAVRRLPVATEGKVVGIVSRSNLIQALLRRAQATPGPAGKLGARPPKRHT